MIEKSNQKKSKYLLAILIIVNISFLFLYELFFKIIFLEKIAYHPEEISIYYYSSIFENLHIAIIFVILCLIIVYALIGRFNEIINRYSEKKHVLYIAITANVIIQFAILLFIKTEPISDSIYYINQAERFLSTGNYINETGDKTAFWPVGLPAILSVLNVLTENPLLLFKIFNVLVSTLTIIILDNVFRDKLTKKQRIIFLFLYVLFPNNLFSVNTILTDFPFTLLLWLVILIVQKDLKFLYGIIIIGVITALMSYLRPTALLFPLIFFLYYYKKHTFDIAVKKTSIIVFTVFLLLSPWIYRNYVVFDSFVPIATNGGFNFLMGNHKYSNGGLNFNFDYDISNPNEVQEERKAYKKGINDIIENPVKALLRIPLKIFHSYKRGDSSVTWSLKKTENEIHPIFLSIVFYFTNLFFFIIIILSIIPLYKILINKYEGNFFLLLKIIFVFFVLIIAIYVGGERYIIPIIPIHFFAASKFIYEN